MDMVASGPLFTRCSLPEEGPTERVTYVVKQARLTKRAITKSRGCTTKLSKPSTLLNTSILRFRAMSLR
ncbi:hypothetical protein QL093DRAFT_2272279 [Fusarium oxysporum]|nr:hypothetical protein QL093DRAFT_2272279 [Fusarium oxysporum]